MIIQMYTIKEYHWIQSSTEHSKKKLQLGSNKWSCLQYMMNESLILVHLMFDYFIFSKFPLNYIIIK